MYQHRFYVTPPNCQGWLKETSVCVCVCVHVNKTFHSHIVVAILPPFFMFMELSNYQLVDCIQNYR